MLGTNGTCQSSPLLSVLLVSVSALSLPTALLFQTLPLVQFFNLILYVDGLEMNKSKSKIKLAVCSAMYAHIFTATHASR